MAPWPLDACSGEAWPHRVWSSIAHCPFPSATFECRHATVDERSHRSPIHPAIHHPTRASSPRPHIGDEQPLVLGRKTEWCERVQGHSLRFAAMRRVDRAPGVPERTRVEAFASYMHQCSRHVMSLRKTRSGASSFIHTLDRFESMPDASGMRGRQRDECPPGFFGVQSTATPGDEVYHLRGMCMPVAEEQRMSTHYL